MMRITGILVILAVFGLLLSGCTKKDNPAPAAGSGNGQADTQTAPQPAAEASAAADHDALAALWMTDFEAAKAKAAAENKDLLIDFSGSDWCYWCKRLDSEVFSKPGFMEQAAKDFVFVVIDFPQDKSGQSASLQDQNRRLAQQYGIEGYPTIILARPNGELYARTGYQEGGPDAYLQHLKELRTPQQGQ